jgi:hypothetical protein
MDLKHLLDSFYDKLVLRDLVGKVVPGIAFIFSLVAGLIGIDILDHLLDKMTPFLWIVVVGFAWLLGFALQALGEVTHFLRTHPEGKTSFEIDPKPPWTRESFYELWAEFHDKSSQHEKIHAERLNVIKEACGNATISISSALFFACIGIWKRIIDFTTISPFLFVGLILSGLLLKMHVTHIERYGEFVFRTILFRRSKPIQEALETKDGKTASISNDPKPDL